MALEGSFNSRAVLWRKCLCQDLRKYKEKNNKANDTTRKQTNPGCRTFHRTTEPMFSHLCFDCVLLLLLLLHTRSLESTNIFKVGQNALLPCRYTPASSGNLVPVCWGRGVCPVFQCHDTVLSTGERSVIYRKSSRYHLKGDFHKGDVSLLIENVTPADSGTYCCRIQYPGPMNDGKLTLELVIIPAKVIPAPTAQTDRTTAFPRTLTTKEQGSETQTLLTFHDRNQIQGFTLASEFQGSTATTRIHVYVGVGVSAGVAVILVFGACILKSPSPWTMCPHQG
ncbi:hepatitis A virus cellular receptor 2 isoform X2 [Lepus europaeus]|uniref:hepatitis A virus cellular receptor 2 isoform X2 n=1 Tax=Lepus europaeus TaxID=9983 RepID=UPI002B45B882|nr:hepatitis A virus cellular receptor 2 isoform X2 [Lepus europaeus]